MKICLSNQDSFRVKNYYLRITASRFLRICFTMYFFVYYCTGDCPNVCDCKWKDGKESVICVNTNLTSIPKNLDPGILVFHFVGNSLLKLSNDAFELAGLLNLQKLYLIKCNIKYIDRYAFRTLKNLVDLDLSYNVLTIVPSQAFAPIPDLRELKLNGNPILKIGGYAFTHVHQLIRLEISECRIGYVDRKAFSGLEHTLELLKLNKNRLTNVYPETFTILQTLHALDFNDNPLNCSCIIRPLRDWIISRNLSTGKFPLCRYPLYNSNKSWDKLQSDDFACLPSIQAPIKNVNAYEGDNVTLMCKIDGTPAPDVRWTLRNRVLSNNTLGYPVMNKRSYLIHSLSNNYSNLTILALEMQDTGEYVCIAENKAGKVIANIALMIEKAPIGTILSEKVVLIGILLTTILIIFLCSIILFIRVMYCKHDTRADIESKRRIISEKIEMKRNSANMKRSASVSPSVKIKNINQNSVTDEINQKSDKCNFNNVSEEEEQRPARPKDFNEIKSKSTVMETSQSPGSSIFESHIGEIALQHHVLHKKELPTGKLYTTAMAFMTDNTMMNYENEGHNSSTSKKKIHYNTMPKNYTSNNRAKKNLSINPRVSESQSPLLRNKCYESSSESLDSNGRSLMKNYHQHEQFTLQKSVTPNTLRKSRDGYWAYPSLPSSPDKDKYWIYSDYPSTKETPLLNNIYNGKSKNSSVNYSTYSYSKGTIEPSLATATYDYHAAQLERFLDEYRRLHSELTKMKETCDKFSQKESYFCKNTVSGRSYDSSSFRRRRFDSKTSLHRPLSSKSRSFDRPLPSKSCSFERSVSFVPALKDASVKTAGSDDIIIPKSILKKKNEQYYYSYDRKSYDHNIPYSSSTLPLKKSRLRRFSDSSVEGYFN